MQIPLGTFTVVTGVSGSGKSSLVEDVLYASLARTLHRAKTRARRPRCHSRRGTDQQGDPRRSAAAGPDADLEPGHVHRRVRPDPHAVRPIARGQAARLHAAAVQLQRGRRAVREVRGQRATAHRDALPARRVGRVRHVPRPALQSRDAGRSLPRPVDRRRARHVVRRGGEAVREHSQDPPRPCRRSATWGSTI